MTEPPEPLDTHFEIELDDKPAPTREPVYVDAVVREHERPPIVPASLRGRDNLKATVRYHAGRTAYRAGYHAARSPKYAGLATFWSVIGVFKVIWRQLRWWWHPELSSMLQHAANTNDLKEGAKAHERLNAARLNRGLWLLAELVGLAVAVPLLIWVVPWWVSALVVLAVVPLLAHVGRPVDQRIISPAIVEARYRKLNPDIVLRAYYAAKLGDPDKHPVKFASVMAVDARQRGTEVVIDLDYGYHFADVVKAKPALASGLDVTSQQVFLTRDKTSDRRHTLYVAREDPLAIPAGKTDMLDLKPRNIWRPMKLGNDERGNLVTLLLLWNSILVGAMPRRGKTFFVRLILLFAALDPWVKILFADGKKSSDYDKFRLVAHRMVIGDAPNPRDNDPITHLLEMLDEVLDHIAKVNDILASLPPAMCPEGKLTEELARDPRYPELRVWVIAGEEFQVYFETEDQDINKQIASKWGRIMAQGPSAGVILLDSSQKPSGVGAGDVGRLFNRFRDNHQIRFALRCGNRVVSEAVLGGDAYSEGYDASALPIGDGQNGTIDYRGVGILYGASDQTPTLRTFLANHEDAEKILIAARRHREAAGTLSGYAAGEEVAREVRDVLRDAHSVFWAGEAWISWERLAQRLAEALPEHYADITKDSISAQVRALGVEYKAGKQDGRTIMGAKREHIEMAIKRREIEAGR